MSGDEDTAARGRHTRELRDGAFGPQDVVQRAARAGEVERAGFEGEARRIALDEAGVRRRVGAGVLEQLRNDVDSDDLAHEWRERQCQRPRTGADVERPFVAGRRDERLQLLSHRLHLTVGMLGDAFGSGAEPCAHLVDVRVLRHR